MAAGENKSFECVILRGAAHVADETFNLVRRLGFRRFEDRNDALFNRPFRLAIATSRRLRDLIEPGLGAPDTREIEVHARFNQTCGQYAARSAVFQSLLHLAENFAPIGRDLPRAEMNDAFETRRFRCPIERERMRSAVDNDKYLSLLT